MDAMALLRMLGALGVVLGLLGLALWAVRRFNIRLPGRVGGGALRRVEIVERAAIDPRRSIALLRRDGREHLILLAPEGNMIVEAAIVRDEIDLAAEKQRRREAEERQRIAEEALASTKAEMKALRSSFASMVEKKSSALRENVGRASGVSGNRFHAIAASAQALKLKLKIKAEPAICLIRGKLKLVSDMLGAKSAIARQPTFPKATQICAPVGPTSRSTAKKRASKPRRPAIKTRQHA